MRLAERLLKKIRPQRDADNSSPHASKLFAEWRQDHAMAKERKETGMEPDCRPLDVKRMASGDAETRIPHVSAKDLKAIEACEARFARDGGMATEKDKNEWVREWRGLDEEQRQDQVSMQHRDRDTGIDR